MPQKNLDTNLQVNAVSQNQESAVVQENELNEQDLKAISGGYPGHNPVQIMNEQRVYQSQGLYIHDSGYVVKFDNSGRGTAIYPDGRTRPYP